MPAAVDLARVHHPLLLETAAHADGARAAQREASRARLPRIELREVAVRTDSPADAFGLQLMQERFSFPAFANQNPNDPNPIEDFATEVEATLPLFTGGRLSAGIRQADRAARSAAATVTYVRATVELGVLHAFLDRAIAQRFVELAEDARATTGRHVGQAEDFFETGMIVESDLLRARVQLARMEENVIGARHRLELSRAELNRAMGVPLGSDFDLVEPSDTTAGADVPSQEEAIQRALAGRADLAAARSSAEGAAFDVRGEIAGYLPEVALRGVWSLHDDRFLEFDGRSTAVMGVLRWRLFDGGQTAARVTRARRGQDASRERVRALEHQIEMEVRQAWQSVDDARARRAVTRETVGAAERALQILEDRYAQGVARTTELLDAEMEAHEARVRDTQARYDIGRALGTLRFAVGDAPIAEVGS